jgi:hypothetical protein
MNDLKIDINPVKNIVNQFVDAVRATLQRNGSNASGDLSNSIKGTVKTSGKWIEISISLEDYWKYIEYGTKPHFPPIDAIRMWIDVKPILPRPLPNGKLPTKQQLAFLIARKISRVGTKAKPFLFNTLEKFNLEEVLYETVMEEINKKINEEIQNDLG